MDPNKSFFSCVSISLDNIMDKKKTLVIGGSDNPARYSYLAIQKLRRFEHPVEAIGRRNTQVADVPIVKEKKPFEGIDTVTLYLNPFHQQEYYDYIISLKPRRIIFNPGTENTVLASLARESNIQTLEACTLVLLSTGQY
jgi:predicted CoA-binding protein